MGISILFVENEVRYAQLVCKILERGGYFVTHFDCVETAVESIKGGLEYDVAVFDIEFGDGTIEDLIASSKDANPNVPIIAFSGYLYQSTAAPAYHVSKILGSKGIMDAIESLIKAK